MAEFNQVVGEFCIRREYVPPQPLPGFPNNPPAARRGPVTIFVVDVMEKILMPTESRVVHQKIRETVPADPGPLAPVVNIDASSLPNGYAYLIVKVLECPTFIDVLYTDWNNAAAEARLGNTQILAIPLVQDADIDIRLQGQVAVSSTFEVDVLLIGSEDAIVTP